MACITDCLDAFNRRFGHHSIFAILLQSHLRLFKHWLDLLDLLDTLEVFHKLVPVLDEGHPMCVTDILLGVDEI